jgi:uncharacterized membrane protein (DUF373 family)
MKKGFGYYLKEEVKKFLDWIIMPLIISGIVGFPFVLALITLCLTVFFSPFRLLFGLLFILYCLGLAYLIYEPSKEEKE